MKVEASVEPKLGKGFGRSPNAAWRLNLKNAEGAEKGAETAEKSLPFSGRRCFVGYSAFDPRVTTKYCAGPDPAL